MPVHFKTSENKTYDDPDKISGKSINKLQRTYKQAVGKIALEFLANLGLS